MKFIEECHSKAMNFPIKFLNHNFLDHCRQLEFRAEQMFHGRRLMNHVIRITDVTLEDFCETLCYMEPNCVSYNIMTSGETGKHKCELNNVTHEGHEEDLVNNSSYTHRGAKVIMFKKIILFLILN